MHFVGILKAIFFTVLNVKNKLRDLTAIAFEHTSARTLLVLAAHAHHNDAFEAHIRIIVAIFVLLQSQT